MKLGFRVIAAAILLTFASAAAAFAASADYRTAESAFYAGGANQRYETPILLIATGFYNGMSTGEFGPRIFRGIQDFQASIGGQRTGYLTTQQLAQLRSAGFGALAQWGLAEIINPYTDAKLFVPKKVTPLGETTRRGYAFEAYDHAYSVDFSFFAASESSLEDLYLRMSSARGGRRIDYKVIRPAFFAIAGGVGARSSYTRYQIARGGIVGFTASWDTDRFEHGERIAVLMSNMFHVALTGESVTMPVAGVPVAPSPQIVIAPPPVTPAPAPIVAPAPPPAEPKKEESRQAGAEGTGFYVTPKRLLTNAHVVKGCQDVTILLSQSKSAGKVLARDEKNDLALVESDATSEAVAKLRSGVRLGEDVAAFGFPLAGLLANSCNFTRGNITATAGVGDDTSALQISAPVQPGNSGGPLVDESGNVVGVVRSKLDAVLTLIVAKDIPQNVNFAIKSSVAQTFLETNGADFSTASELGEALKPADLAAKAQAFSAKIECSR